MTAFDQALMRANRLAIVAMLAAMALMVFANVALRYTTGQSILWAEEASRYLMIWLTFIGAGPVLRYGAHIGIDTLQERFPRQAPFIRATIVALLLVFFVVMTWLGVRYAMLTWAQTTPVLELPVGAVYLAMPIGFALLALHLLLMAHGYIVRHEHLSDAHFDSEAARL
ncbi:MAG TPA: TRAP transporter small permease [Casimicrobiaceae bacterium]|nr:TRAP transporter small permease [Casimicrobiaceae bacterium]